MLCGWVPSLESEARLFTERTRNIQEDRRKANIVLENQEKLLDVLELPNLIATCVQNGYYPEALDLADHFEKNLLSSSLPKTSLLLQSVHTSVLASMQSLLNQLLSQLRGQAKLPVLFKTVNLLRRMGVLTEEQLAIAFIHGRSDNLDESFRRACGDEGSRSDDPAKWLRKWIEVFREGVYDAVTQYSSIFLSPSSSTSHTAPQDAEGGDRQIFQLRSFLLSFTHTYLKRLLSVVRQVMPEIQLADMSSVASLITQLTYCGSSFSRIGLDFRGLLPSVVEDSVFDIIQKGFLDAQSSLHKTIADATRARKSPSQWLVIGDLNKITARDAPRTPMAVHIPPAHLTSFPPIAVFTNQILQSLNALRLAAPLSIYPRLREAEMSVLLDMSASLASYCESQPWDDVAMDDDETQLKTARLISAVRDALWGDSGVVGYLVMVFCEGVYGRQDSLEEPNGAWMKEKERWERLCQMDVATVGES
ncbi:Dor1-like family-domain-containing protein [Cantharellus anzutake]|uniref:Dor1-like family-domain-containing protein n=1 Tax=Cantharellus anzutake TaxID=1750568 RepID=UPI0019066774|nr:Dor1-like family-domain-containing protein [Cantharellus anzutake]KAF8336555.1 Dor1-like family-domain-containing protein [Cantharellus anzutake]